MAKAIKCVCVWLDTDGSTWIVSHDTLDDQGRAETTTTLDTCDSETEAIASGRAEAKKLGLPLYCNPANGPAVLVIRRVA